MKRLYGVITILSLSCGITQGMDQKGSQEKKRRADQGDVCENIDQLYRASRLPKPVMGKIFATYHHEIELLAMRHREELLPAILNYDFNDHNKKVVALRTVGLSDPRKMLQDSYINNRQAIVLLGRRERFIVKAVIVDQFTYHYGVFNVLVTSRDNANLDQQIKNPQQLFGGPIGVGRYGMLLWSDGSQQIIISESDRRRLNNLSREQLEFIVSLYSRRFSNDSNLTVHEVVLFETLDPSIQDRLKDNYGLYFESSLQTIKQQQRKDEQARNDLVLYAGATMIATALCAAAYTLFTWLKK